MFSGRSITLWTARLSMALLAVSFVLLLRRNAERRGQQEARLIWTAACAIFVLHVAAAFHFVHHWSNASAIRATADQTRQILGFSVGGGLYASYAFLVLWIFDVIIWWAAPDWREKQRGIRTVLIGFMAFIAFNAAVIFALAPSRWVSLMVTLALIALVISRVAQNHLSRDGLLK